MLVGWTKTAPKIAAYILVIVNVLTIVFATFLFAISLWLIASPNTLVFAIQTFGTTYMKVWRYWIVFSAAGLTTGEDLSGKEGTDTDKVTDPISLQRRTRQGNFLVLKLFLTEMEDVF